MKDFKHNYWAQRFEKCYSLKEIELTAHEHLEDVEDYVKKLEDFCESKDGLFAELKVEISKKALQYLRDWHNTDAMGKTKYHILSLTFADAIGLIYISMKELFNDAIRISKDFEDKIGSHVTEIYNAEQAKK